MSLSFKEEDYISDPHRKRELDLFFTPAEEQDQDIFLEELWRQEQEELEQDDECWEIIARQNEERRKERENLAHLATESVNIILNGLRVQ